MLIFIVLLVLSWIRPMEAAENHLASIITNLSTIFLQSDFMHSSQNLNPVLAEFLNIGDPNVIPELLKIKVSTLSTDVQGLLESVKEGWSDLNCLWV